MFRRLFVTVFAAWAGLASTSVVVPAETIFPLACGSASTRPGT